MSGGSAGAYTVLYTTSAYARGLEPLMRTGFFFPVIPAAHTVVGSGQCRSY